MASNPSGPMLTASGRPMADHSEYLPPTQSQTLNILSAGIPSSAAAPGRAVIAANCRAGSGQPLSLSQRMALRAFSRVSRVPNDFDPTLKIVVCGSHDRSVRNKS
jgi:hypothetical protein